MRLQDPLFPLKISNFENWDFEGCFRVPHEIRNWQLEPSEHHH